MSLLRLVKCNVVAIALVSGQLALGAVGSVWKNDQTAEARVRAVIKHQNQLRREASLAISKKRKSQVELPQLSLMLVKDAYNAPLITEDGKPARIWIEQGYPEMGSTGYFRIVDDLLIKSDYNDFWSLNYVYSFKSDGSLDAVPFAVWRLEQKPEKEISLYRSMSADELQKWSARTLADAGAAHWGFGEAEGRSPSVFHFSEKPWNGQANVRVRIAKKVLLEWTRKKPAEVWAGALDHNESAFEQTENFEFILTREMVVSLLAQGYLTIELL